MTQAPQWPGQDEYTSNPATNGSACSNPASPTSNAAASSTIRRWPHRVLDVVFLIYTFWTLSVLPLPALCRPPQVSQDSSLQKTRHHVGCVPHPCRSRTWTDHAQPGTSSATRSMPSSRPSSPRPSPTLRSSLTSPTRSSTGTRPRSPTRPKRSPSSAAAAPGTSPRTSATWDAVA